jgi:hypothetical protein
MQPRAWLGVVGFALVLALPALADDLLWLQAEEARRAVAELAPGACFVDWMSHFDPTDPGGRPVLWQTVEARAVTVGAHVEVVVSALRLAEGEPSARWDDAFAWSASRKKAPETLRLDLAYVYVPSAELPRVFVNLGRKLGLECSVRSPAIEVPPGQLPRAPVLR